MATPRKPKQSPSPKARHETYIDKLVQELEMNNQIQAAQNKLIFTQFENLGGQNNDIKLKLISLEKDAKRTIELVFAQNGRVGKLEEGRQQAIRDHIRDRDDIDEAIKAHLQCPGETVMKEFNDYRKKMAPLYAIATSLKIMIFVVILTILLTNQVPAIKEWVRDMFPPQIEIGI